MCGCDAIGVDTAGGALGAIGSACGPASILRSPKKGDGSLLTCSFVSTWDESGGDPLGGSKVGCGAGGAVGGGLAQSGPMPLKRGIGILSPVTGCGLGGAFTRSGSCNGRAIGGTLVLVEVLAAADIDDVVRCAKELQYWPWRSNWPESESDSTANVGCGRGGDTALSGGGAFRVIGGMTTAGSVVVGALVG